MKKILCFLILHVKKQWVMYLLPLTFVYIFLTQYQQQLLAVMDENTLVNVFDISQKYVCLFFMWYQYLSWRYVLFNKQKEVVKFESLKKRSWFILNFIFTYILLSGYLIWLMIVTNGVRNVFMISVQFFLLSMEIALLINLIELALPGLMIFLMYIFLCMTRYIPDDLCIIRLGTLPENYGFSWVAGQVVLCMILLGCIKCRKRSFFISNGSD